MFVAGVAWADAATTNQYVAMLDASGTLPADSLPLERSVPAEYSDARTWVRYAIDIAESGNPRVRWTTIDNAPRGREVHWSSAFGGLLAVAGVLQQHVTGEPLPRAIESTLAWFNGVLVVAVVALFSWWVAIEAGAAAGVLTAFSLVGFRWFYAGFASNYVDHHGLLSAATYGVALGAVFMGAGWYSSDASASLLPKSRRAIRRAAIVSALIGGLGLWISAASVIPTIALVGIAGAVVGSWLGPDLQDNGFQFDADAWRLWGLVGCVTSLVTYAIEYVPHNIALRLEVNHPLYAFAWLGGGEIVAALLSWRLGRTRPKPWRLATALVFVLAPALVVALLRSRVFVPLDLSISRFHTHVEELSSLPKLVRELGSGTALWFVPAFLVLLPAGFVYSAKHDRRLLLAFSALIVVPLVALACWQVRWWLIASGPELVLLLVAVLCIAHRAGRRAEWLATAMLCLYFSMSAAQRIAVTRRNVAERAVSPQDALQPMYRDAAEVIRRSSAGAPVVLLASPSASTAIGYYGRFQTLASFYWENLAGVTASAAIFSSTTDDEARRLIEARGITHVAMVSANNFLRNYLDLVNPAASDGEWKETFGYRLLTGEDTATWLRRLPFRPRFPSGSRDVALLFQVDPMQNALERDWNEGVAMIADGNSAGARDAFLRAIRSASTTRRGELYTTAGQIAYESNDHRLAIQLLDSAMSAGSSNTAAKNRAWILATSADDSVRDGPAALDAARRLLRLQPRDMQTLDVLGAALAETGRLTEAMDVAREMGDLAHAAGDVAGERRANQRLSVYEAGRPWRQ